MKTTLAAPLTRRLAASLLAAMLSYSESILAADWPMFGRDQTRNAVSPEKNPPRFWKLEVDPQGQPVPGRGQNVKWIARLGDLSFGALVVAIGCIWIRTHNEQPRDPAVKEDAAVLMCFRESDGEFVWQYVAPRKKGVRSDSQYTVPLLTVLTESRSLLHSMVPGGQWWMAKQARSLPFSMDLTTTPFIKPLSVQMPGRSQ